MLRKKLQVELKNTPTDTPLVCSSVSSGLNKEETPSVQSKVLACNTPEVNLLQHTGDQNLRVSDIMYVPVLNILNKGFLVFSFIERMFFTLFFYCLVFKKGGYCNSSHD